MTFTIEVLIKGTDEVVERVIERAGNEPADWTEDDIRDVLTETLLNFDRVQNPQATNRTVSLRGFSWIVTPVEGGVVIAIEIPSGAVVAGPFATDAETLTAGIRRVLASPQAAASSVH